MNWDNPTKPLKQQLDSNTEKIQKKTCLTIIITLHFVSVIASAIYSSSNNIDLMLLKFITQLVFIIWGFVLCSQFLLAGRKVLGEMGDSKEGGGSGKKKINEKGIAGLLAGVAAPGQNLASSLTAALAPTLLRAASTPKIKITDENDRTVSVASDSSKVVDSVVVADSEQNVSVRPITIPTSSSSCYANPITSPTAGPSKGYSKQGTFKAQATTSESDSSGRPPSPVLPTKRKKSGGGGGGTTTSGASGGPGQSDTGSKSSSSGNRRIRLNKNQDGSGSGTDKETHGKKKTLSWSENEVISLPSNNSSGRKRGKSLGDDKTDVKSPDKISGVSAQGIPDGSRRKSSRKSLNGGTQQNSIGENNVESGGNAGGSNASDSLLMSGSGPVPDFTLQSILSHIAYVNQTALDYRLSRKLSRKNQVQKVIKFTSIIAVLLLLLCAGELVRILSPYGIFAAFVPPDPWPWFILQTILRLIEFSMGAVVANIAKQPVNRPQHHYGAYSIRHKHQRESLYL